MRKRAELQRAAEVVQDADANANKGKGGEDKGGKGAKRGPEECALAEDEPESKAFLGSPSAVLCSSLTEG